MCHSHRSLDVTAQEVSIKLLTNKCQIVSQDEDACFTRVVFRPKGWTNAPRGTGRMAQARKMEWNGLKFKSSAAISSCLLSCGWRNASSKQVQVFALFCYHVYNQPDSNGLSFSIWHIYMFTICLKCIFLTLSHVKLQPYTLLSFCIS